VTIIIDDQLESVLTVPLQAIVGSVELGKERKCFVMNADGLPEERTIVVGLSNDKMAEIKSGLQDGDEVVLNPKALISDKAKLTTTNGVEAGPTSVGTAARPEGGSVAKPTTGTQDSKGASGGGGQAGQRLRQ
jgi:hypothetical protein